ncbi:hypothetical protein NPIL_429761, partial [Nephila pilipes]
MVYECYYCNVEFNDIEHYLRHKYITHNAQELFRPTSDDELTWNSFFESFGAWSRREFAILSTTRSISHSEYLEKTDAGCSSANQAQYSNFKTVFASESYSEESETKRLKSKSSGKFCNDKPPLIEQDHDQKKTSGCLTAEKISSSTHTDEKLY